MKQITWKRGTREPLFRALRHVKEDLPRYAPGRGKGVNWPLPCLSEDTAPVRVPVEARPGLISLYEEYLDLYFVTCDATDKPRKWLHDRVPAEAGVLEHVFPLLPGETEHDKAAILLVRLVWLIQQAGGLPIGLTSEEATVLTPAGRLGVQDGMAYSRFVPEGVPLDFPAKPVTALHKGMVRVFNNAMNAMYAAFGDLDRHALTMLATRTPTRLILQRFYSDTDLTKDSLGRMKASADRIFSIELALSRSEKPADVLQQILVPAYITLPEFRQLFEIPWKKEDRDKIGADHLIRKLPALREILQN